MSRLRAYLTSTFWLSCPVCHYMHGGYQWRDRNGHLPAIPIVGRTNGVAICPTCTKQGVGCYANARNRLAADGTPLDVYIGHGEHCLTDWSLITQITRAVTAATTSQPD